MKQVALALLWLVASAGAVSIAWAGVGVVDSTVVTPAPATVAPIVIASPASAANDSDDDADDSAGGNPADDDTTSDDPPDDVNTDEVAGDKGDTGESGDTGSNEGAGDLETALAPPSPPRPAVTTTTAAPSSSDSSASAPTTPTTTPPPPTTTTAPPETITFTTIGGTAAISFSPTNVEILWATPVFGYKVETSDESPGVKVEFRSESESSLRSRLTAWWNDGPQSDLEERGQ